MKIYFKKDFVYRMPEKHETKPEGFVIASGEHEGFKFFIKDINGKHPTAYVCVPKGHPLYRCEQDYNNPIYDCLDVWGGVTYADDVLLGAEIPKDSWVIGWDYAHAGDFCGSYLDRSDEWYEGLRKHTTDEIINECERVCNKLKEMTIASRLSEKKTEEKRLQSYTILVAPDMYGTIVGVKDYSKKNFPFGFGGRNLDGTKCESFHHKEVYLKEDVDKYIKELIEKGEEK